MEEIWKDVKGYEGIYQVSNCGRVRRLDRITAQGHFLHGRILKPDVNKLGYHIAAFSKNGVKERIRVHRLVAMHFLDNKDNLPVINHKDENPSNNHVDNLEWCTMMYNNLYNDRHKKVGKSLEKAIYVIDGDCDYYFDSAREASRELGLNEAHVSACLRGELKTHHGYSYERVEA